MQKFDDNVSILLVDDDDDAQNMLRTGLTDAGMRVAVADSGEHALESLAQTLPDAILLDVIMPGLDGFATCGKIRMIDENLPVIFMTGLGETEHIVRGFEVGGTDYVTKPVSIPVVIARLQSHTRVSRMIRTTREALGAMDTAMLAHDKDFTLLWNNESARKLFATLTAEKFLEEGKTLPFRQNNEPQTEQAFVVAVGTGAVEVRRMSSTNDDITICMLKQVDAAPSQEWQLPRLTDRETEVLLWVARGKTNRDIGEILGMSPRTVNKHLEHIFEKLGVETRTAAAAAASRRFGQSNV